MNLNVPKFFCHCHCSVSSADAKELQNNVTLTDTFSGGTIQQFQQSLPDIFSATVTFAQKKKKKKKKMPVAFSST
jgi:hypothetical protein